MEKKVNETKQEEVQTTTRTYVNYDEIAKAISDEPGITASELADKFEVQPQTMYARIAKMRASRRIRTFLEGGVSRYYPFNYALTVVPGLDAPATPLQIGETTIKARTISAEQLQTLLKRSTVPTKYAEMLGYLDRVNVSEAAVFDAQRTTTEDIRKEAGAMRSRIRDWFKDEKKFSINVHGRHILIERIK